MQVTHVLHVRKIESVVKFLVCQFLVMLSQKKKALVHLQVVQIAKLICPDLSS